MPAGGQLFSVNSLGGFYASFNLSKEIRQGVRHSVKFRQFCDIKDAWASHRKTGQTFTWDTTPIIARGNRALTETSTIPQGQHTVIQGTMTLLERGFSVPYTEMLESLAMVSVRAPIMKQLKQDAATDIDCAAHAEFNKTPLRYVATSSASTDAFTGTALTTNSTATLTNTSFLSKIHVRTIVDGMKGRNIPYYTDSDYYAIARPESLKLFKSDIESVHQYTETGLSMIMNGEVGRYWNCRFVEATVVPAGGANDTTTFDPFTDTGDAWNGSAGDWVFFFGEDTVTEGVCTSTEIRAKMAEDFGRSKGIAHYSFIGFGLAHGFGGANPSQARIVKFDSAA